MPRTMHEITLRVHPAQTYQTVQGSGRASGNPGGGSNLQPDCYDDSARYLINVARRLIEVEGSPVR